MLKSYLRIETGAKVYPEDLKSTNKFLKGHKDHFAIMNAIIDHARWGM